SIYDTDESKKLLEGVMGTHKMQFGVNTMKIRDAISWSKNHLVTPEEYVVRNGSLLSEAVKDVYPKYQEELLRANAVDFDDMLVHVVSLLRDKPKIADELAERYKYILVDEYQDTNIAQYAIVRIIAERHHNLSVTGDPDQSIYGWRGADIGNILGFEKDFPVVKVVKLEQNYRSTPEILSVASQLIKNNKARKSKRLFTENESGQRVRLLTADNQREEAELIANEIAAEVASGRRRASDYAVFYRMNALSRSIERALRAAKVPFKLFRALEFFNRKEIKDLTAYLCLLNNPSDIVSFTRIINEPVRGIGQTTVKKIVNYARGEALPILDAARTVENIPLISPRIRRAIKDFVTMIDELRELANGEYPVETILTEVLRKTKYEAMLDDDAAEEEIERKANVKEFMAEACEFDKRPLEAGEMPLDAFLERISLVSDADAYEVDNDCVSLMTFHAAKGLEFPVVYIIGLEDNILPHERSETPKQIEEERRLFFVGITRAREALRLSHSNMRDQHGRSSYTISSRFLFELPREEMEVHEGVQSVNIADETYVVYEEKHKKNPDIALETFDDQPDDTYDCIDAEYDETGNPITKKPEKPKRDPVKFSIMTAAELEKKMRALECSR
ncbi:MAG: UvrD-helicase domain-containing protein, partial [Planctomycetaceae bacterium]|nr:UvrD-helicase domain-containing protein [Planctomycetaceae bacterium]